MKKLITLLFLATSIEGTIADNTNSVTNRAIICSPTNYPTIKLETNRNWRIEANKYSVRPCPNIYIREKGVEYPSP